jgi:hypothetical protein
LVLQDGLLALVVAKGLGTEKEFVEYDTHAPDIYLVSNLRRVLLEALRCLIPVSSHSLRGQFYLFMALIDNFAQTKIGDFDFSIMKDYVLRLQIEVDDFLLALIEVLEPTQDLRNDKFRLLLRNHFVLLEIDVKIWP